MDAVNVTKQNEEIDALSSIYGEDWVTESDITRSYKIKITDNKNEIILYVTMPPEYPTQTPPKYELFAPWMDRKAKEQLHHALDEVYLDNIGETVVYQWVEKIREVLQNIKPPEVKEKQKTESKSVDDALDLEQLELNCPAISHGEVIVDRKSSFQGHAAEVHSFQDVQMVLAKLKQNKKIQNAFHNMYAYRIERQAERGGTTMLQDCDDDGEAHAGGRLLHLLQILDQRAAVVVVSRWYGGIQLGPDRFRHINNAARSALLAAKLIDKLADRIIQDLKLELDLNCPAIYHGEKITDRKSTFQGHAAEVHSLQDVQMVLAKLKQNKKIQKAFHNMYAYRIETQTEQGGTTMLQDGKDDGEAHAGGNLLHLLQMLDLRGAIVVVTRWYGGIQLGPDRFRHINNAARSALLAAKLIDK